MSEQQQQSGQRPRRSRWVAALLPLLALGIWGRTGALTPSEAGAGGTLSRALAQAGVTLSASPPSLAPGGIVTATWSGVPSPTSTDWFGLYVAGAPDSAALSWRYTTGLASDTVGFQLPSSMAPGTYELRLFRGGDGTRLAVSNPFTLPRLTVSPPSLAPGGILTVTWSGISNPTSTDWLGLYPLGADDTDPPYSWRYTDGSASGQTGHQLRSDLPPGVYQVRLFSNATWLRLAVSDPFSLPALSVSPATASPGASVTVGWNGVMDPTGADWLGLFAAGAPDTEMARLSWRPTSGASSGVMGYALPADLPSGTYELRLFSNGTWRRLAVSNTLSLSTTGTHGPECSPRAPVTLQFDAPTGFVRVTAGTGGIQTIRFGAATNA